MCPREGKQCDEFMCGNMIDGICCGKPKESDYDRGYQQGRADAFDEFKKFLGVIDKGLLEIFNQFHSEVKGAE